MVQVWARNSSKSTPQQMLAVGLASAAVTYQEATDPFACLYREQHKASGCLPVSPQ